MAAAEAEEISLLSKFLIKSGSRIVGLNSIPGSENAFIRT